MMLLLMVVWTVITVDILDLAAGRGQKREHGQAEDADLAVKHLSEESPMWGSMLRDSIAPTMMQAGVRVNVIPSEPRPT